MKAKINLGRMDQKAVVMTKTLRVRFSQPGVKHRHLLGLSDLARRFGVDEHSALEWGTGYGDGRVTATATVTVARLPGAFVRAHRKNGHTSTSIGPWLLDTENVDQ